MRGDLIRATRCFRVVILRGREAVRADRRLRTDEKHIRAQSTISDKTTTLSFFCYPELCFLDGWFLSVQKTQLARAARNGRSWQATVVKTPYIVGLWQLDWPTLASHPANAIPQPVGICGNHAGKTG
jgi:hypothetical protein